MCGLVGVDVVKIFGNGGKITWSGQNRANDQVKQNMKMITKCKFGFWISEIGNSEIGNRKSDIKLCE